jgi:hypothetical protein
MSLSFARSQTLHAAGDGIKADFVVSGVVRPEQDKGGTSLNPPLVIAYQASTQRLMVAHPGSGLFAVNVQTGLVGSASFAC